MAAPELTVLIVDDEPPARSRLRALLEEVGGARVLGEAGNGREAVEQAAATAPDLVLMDIVMPVMDGLEAAQHLASAERAPAVVFCTAYDQHALAAFDAAAVDYLLKPVRAERLAQALDRVRRRGPAAMPARAGQARTHLCARLRGNLRLIPVEEVDYLQAEEKYVVVHHAHGADLIEDSLKTLEEEFGGRFLRIHRACLVARDRLAELRRLPDGRVQAVLRGIEATLEVSRRCVPGLRRKVRHL